MSRGEVGDRWDHGCSVDDEHTEVEPSEVEPCEVEPVDTDDDSYAVSNPAVLQALYELWEVDRGAAWDAYGAYGSLCWYADDGLESLTGRDLARFLCDELPSRWTGSPGEHRQVAHALAALLTALGKPWSAAMCTGPATEKVLRTHARCGPAAGHRAARAVLACWDPPDLPGAHSWNPVPQMGARERHAHRLVADALEHAVQTGALGGWCLS